MQSIVRQGIVPIGAVLTAATPATAVPQLTGGNFDYFLMPFLGYCSIVALAWAFYLRRRRNTSQD